MLPADFATLPVLETARLRLRPLTSVDVPTLFSVYSDPVVTRYWSSPALTSEAEAVALLARVQENFRTGTRLQWGIARVSDDVVVGTCSLGHLDKQNRRAEIGYILGITHWGQGLATEAVSRMLGFAFAPADRGGLDLLRIEADIDPRNAASARVLERQGFRLEGLLRERWLVNGEVCDTGLYGLLRREWRASSPA